MQLRLNNRKANPAGYQAMLKLEQAVKEMGVDHTTYELIKIRVSQLNGCAYCVDQHTADLRKMGETEQRINLIVVWREAPMFSEKERAALALAEAVTLIHQAGVPEDLYDYVRMHFDEKEYVALIMTINAINCWNRLAISTGMFPGCFDN